MGGNRGGKQKASRGDTDSAVRAKKYETSDWCYVLEGGREPSGLIRCHAGIDTFIYRPRLSVLSVMLRKGRKRWLWRNSIRWRRNWRLQFCFYDRKSIFVLQLLSQSETMTDQVSSSHDSVGNSVPLLDTLYLEIWQCPTKGWEQVSHKGYL